MSEIDASAFDFAPITAPRNEPLALLLVVLFGPVGLIYTAPRAGAVLTGVALLGAVLTMGFAPLAVWPICILWVLGAGLMHRI